MPDPSLQRKRQGLCSAVQDRLQIQHLNHRRPPFFQGTHGQASRAQGLSGQLEVVAHAQAMKEAGYWDDPVLRQRMIKRYQETDRELKSAR